MKKRAEEETRMSMLRLQEQYNAEMTLRRITAISLIQRVFRAHKVRKSLQGWKKEREKFLILRKADEKTRQGMTYRALEVLGMAPALRSDTAMEYVLRMYPWFLKPTVTDCVENDWDMAAMLAGWKEKKVVMTYRDGIEILRGLWRADVNLKRSKRAVEANIRAYNLARQQYREVHL